MRHKKVPPIKSARRMVEADGKWRFRCEKFMLNVQLELVGVSGD
ncbi:hypothetical protein RSSM_04750 [Rhodopirellula sallentina SM41]|uniref:Uncharacterized protein n=1 Tax=Rhodopirellula sallentina SM41 TaxID=1263870 RepID=M5UCT3_9BACT|nr:hypothetical protein RSSM_04750 [Rhodopirellula sallentina SM41]